MLALKLTTVGNSEGFIVPREARERLHVRKGDTLYLTETPDVGYRRTAHDPAFAAQMAAFEEVLREDHEVRRPLAQR